MLHRFCTVLPPSSPSPALSATPCTTSLLGLPVCGVKCCQTFQQAAAHNNVSDTIVTHSSNKAMLQCVMTSRIGWSTARTEQHLLAGIQSAAAHAQFVSMCKLATSPAVLLPDHLKTTIRSYQLQRSKKPSDSCTWHQIPAKPGLGVLFQDKQCQTPLVFLAGSVLPGSRGPCNTACARNQMIDTYYAACTHAVCG